MHISSSSLIGEFPQFGAQSTSFFWHIQIANTCLKAYFSLCDREYSSLSSACKAFYYKPSTQFKNKQQSSQLTLQTKRKVGQLKSLNRQSQLCNKGFPIVFLGLFVVHWAVDMRSPPSGHVFTAQWTHVHCPVNDGKSAKKDWSFYNKNWDYRTAYYDRAKAKDRKIWV